MKISLGVSGSIAAYKAAALARLLLKDDHEVRCLMTPAATRFLGPTTLEALTGRPVHADVLDPRMEHIDLHRWSDAFVVAPATANMIAKMASGAASDAVSALFIALGGETPTLVAPAMHPTMWTHPATRANVERLKSWGVRFVGPVEGPLADGESGTGRMISPEEIAAAVRALG